MFKVLTSVICQKIKWSRRRIFVSDNNLDIPHARARNTGFGDFGAYRPANNSWGHHGDVSNAHGGVSDAVMVHAGPDGPIRRAMTISRWCHSGEAMGAVAAPPLFLRA
jgi:hypothetical protein